MLDAALADELADRGLVVFAELARQMHRVHAADRGQFRKAGSQQIRVLQRLAHSAQPQRSISSTVSLESARTLRQDFQKDALHRQRSDVVFRQKLAIHSMCQPGGSKSFDLTGTGQHRRLVAQPVQRQRLYLHQKTANRGLVIVLMQLVRRQKSQSALRAKQLFFRIPLNIGTRHNEAEISMRVAMRGEKEPFRLDHLAERKARNLAALDHVPGSFRHRAKRESFFKRYARSIHRLTIRLRTAYSIGRGDAGKVSEEVHTIFYAPR